MSKQKIEHRPLTVSGSAIDSVGIKDFRIPHIWRHKMGKIIIYRRQGMVFVRIQVKGIPEAGKNRHQSSRKKSAEQHAGGQFKKETLSGNRPCKPAYQ